MTDCNKSFQENFQNNAAEDVKVKVSVSDPNNGFLSEKLDGVSGIIFFEQFGVSGNTYFATLDFGVLDNRYGNEAIKKTVNFDLAGGNHNGNVKKSKAGDFQALDYPSNKKSESDFSACIPVDMVSGTTLLSVRWTSKETTSGISIFDMRYQSVKVGETISPSTSNVVSGVYDGSPLKLNESQIEVTGLVEEDDQFLVQIMRLGHLSQDNAPNIKILGVALKFL